MSRVSVILGAIAVVHLATAADLPGLPVEPPANQAGLWLLTGNDAFGYPLRQAVSDDHRTATVAAGWRQADWSLAVSYDILTERNPHGNAPQWGPSVPDPYISTFEDARRTDQLTAMAGRWWATAWRSVRLRAGLGAGLRLDGRLGGGDIQNSTHGTVGDNSVAMPYEHGGMRIDGLVWGVAEARVPLAAGWSASLGGTVLAAEQPAGSVGLRLMRQGGGTDLWLDLTRVMHGDGAMSRTAAGTAHDERGWWVGAGLRLGSASITSFRNIGSDTVGGLVTLSSRSGDQPEDGPGLPGRGEMAWTLASNLAHGRGLEVRALQPLPGGADLGGRVDGYLAYQVYAIDSPLVYDLGLGWQQGVAGFRIAPWADTSPWGVRPRLDIDSGVLLAQADNRGRLDVAGRVRHWSGISRIAIGVDAQAELAGCRLAFGVEGCYRIPWRERTVDFQRLTYDGLYAGPPGEVALVSRGWTAGIRFAARFGP
jgi:hypothetical protein